MSEPASSERDAARLVHREIVQLTILILAAALAFFVTRALAAGNHGMRLRDAAEWHRRGERELRAGRLPEAIELFRRAAARAPRSTPYVLALADALDAAHQDAAAEQALLSLRDVDPEHAGVNVGLAHLSVKSGDQAAAVRYYHAALHALWRPGDRAKQRELRLELIRYLLARGQKERALSELLTLAASLPEDAAWKTRAGWLFLEVDEPRRALDLFRAATELDASNRDARSGADTARALIAVGEGTAP